MNVLRAALIALLVQAVSAPRETTASVEGIVVEAESTRPISGAVVELTGLAARDFRVLSFSTRTSSDGRFIIEGIPPGSAYHLVATNAPNYLPASNGQMHPEDTWVPLALTEGQRLTGIRIALVELSAISGRVVDQNGKGIRDVSVAALNVSYRDGWRLLQSHRVVRTDALGDYRISGLSTGRYVVRVGPRKRRPSSDGTYTYFPAEADPDNAAPVVVSGKTPVKAIDFVLSEKDTYRVRGTVIEATTGRAAGETRVFLVPPKLSPDSSATREVISRNGEFEFRDVASGQYQLFAVSRDSSNSLSGRTAITVNDIDLRDLSVTVRKDFDVAGRITIENNAGPTNFSQAVVILNPGSRGTIDAGLHALMPESRHDSVVPLLRASVNTDGTFVFRGVRSWSYFADVVQAAVPQSRLYVKTILSGTKDVLSDAKPLDLSDASQLSIVLAADAGTLGGRVSDERGNAIAHSHVVVVPDEPFRARRDLYKAVQADASGRFTIPVIAPGSYKVFSWRGVDPGAWYFAEFLRQDENRAVPIVIQPFTAATVDVMLLSDNPHLR